MEVRKCISLKEMKRYKLIDGLIEQGYHYRDLYEMSIKELTQELYNISYE